MIVTIKLYGSIAKFGEEFTLNADTVNDAVRSLILQIPELKKEIEEGFFRVKVAGEYVNQQAYVEGIEYSEETCVVEIYPVIRGSGKFGNIIAGAVLTVIGGIGTYFGQAWGPGLMQVGIGLMVGGVVGLLIKQPRFNEDNQGIADNRSSMFSNLGNNVGQGKQIPRVYGEMRVGSYELSKSSENVRVAEGGSTSNPNIESESVVYDIVPIIPTALRDPDGKLYNIDLNCDSVKSAAVRLVPRWS